MYSASLKRANSFFGAFFNGSEMENVEFLRTVSTLMGILLVDSCVAAPALVSYISGVQHSKVTCFNLNHSKCVLIGCN